MGVRALEAKSTLKGNLLGGLGMQLRRVAYRYGYLDCILDDGQPVVFL